MTALSNASHTYVPVRVVGEDGRRLGGERAVRRIGDAGRVHLTIRDVGATGVDRPDWVEGALANAPRRGG